MSKGHAYNETYSGENVNRVAFPMGGIGAGMICMEGTGALSHASVRNKPDVFNEPLMFAALHLKRAGVARVLEGPVPAWKAFGAPGSGNGGNGKNYGLPRFARAVFRARFPFAAVELADPEVPLRVRVTGWSPFVPGDADSSSLPVASLEYRFMNPTERVVEGVYSFHAANFMARKTTPGAEVKKMGGGFVLAQPGSKKEPWDRGEFAACVGDGSARVNPRWFRGGWFDALTMVWKSVEEGTMPAHPAVGRKRPSPGGSLYVPFKLRPGQTRTIRLCLGWYVPVTSLREGKDAACGCGGKSSECSARYAPWYAGRFRGIGDVMGYWLRGYERLRRESLCFSDCFYDTTLPPEVMEAVAANLTILKSPSVLRQKDGRLWAWEGCCDGSGCCSGSCTHVWNYAQALPHLFPDLERSLRRTEFNESQDERGHQTFRAALPIRPVSHDFHAAADGQLGGIMKVYREWRISGDTDWLRGLWPKVKASLGYAIETWDPERVGVPVEPHHNTYDIEFWGPDSMCGTFYVGALRAAGEMARAMGDDSTEYDTVYRRGRAFLERKLWNGEYFFQKVQWKGLRAADPRVEARKKGLAELTQVVGKEGPRYQVGKGCLADGVLGAWLAQVCGMGDIVEREKIESHLLAVWRHNFRAELSEHANPQRPTFAMGREGGLLLCTWPRGKEPSLPMVYAKEVWTGIEYQVASHLMMTGHVREGLQIVRAARDRYDGRVRNPFNEYECGHWYARAMSSYALLQGLTGVRYDAVDKVLFMRPAVKGDFRAFLCTATGYGTVGIRRGKPFVEVRKGRIPIETIEVG